MNTAPKSWFLPFFNKINQDSLEKWLVLKLGQAIIEMNLECLVVLDSKEVLKHNKKSKIEKLHDGGGMSKGHRVQLKGSKWPKLKHFEA